MQLVLQVAANCPHRRNGLIFPRTFASQLLQLIADPIDFDELDIAFVLERLGLHLQAARGHRKFGAQPVLVRLDLGGRERHRRLDAPLGQHAGTPPSRRRNQHDQETGYQEA